MGDVFHDLLWPGSDLTVDNISDRERITCDAKWNIWDRYDPISGSGYPNRKPDLSVYIREDRKNPVGLWGTKLLERYLDFHPRLFLVFIRIFATDIPNIDLWSYKSHWSLKLYNKKSVDILFRYIMSLPQTITSKGANAQTYHTLLATDYLFNATINKSVSWSSPSADTSHSDRQR